MKAMQTTTSQTLAAGYLAFLDRHLAELLSGEADDMLELNEIARRLYVSHKHLIAVVRDELGHHPCHFYDHKILALAQRLLAEGALSVAEIARRLTYDPSNFTKFFKKYTGQTPGQYQQSLKK